MEETLQLIMEQLRELKSGQEKISAVSTELKGDISTVSTELKTVSVGQDELKTDISAVNAELKTDIIAVEDTISAMQEQPKNDIQDEISDIKEDLKTAGKTELEDRVADKLDKQFKGVTSMAEQQTWNLREDIEATRRDMAATRRDFET
jgi:chromosome segregation ATPase